MLTFNNRKLTIILISAISAMGGFLFGFDIAIVSGTVPFIQEYFGLSDLMLGWGVSSLLVGCVIGSLFTGKLADKFGRKRALVFVALLFAISSVMTALSGNFTIFVTGRIIGGLCVGAASLLSPMYIAEISPASVRGKMGTIQQLMIVSGILVSYLVNYMLHDIGDNNWRWMFFSGSIPSVLFFILLFLVPESPRWLISRGRNEEGLRILNMVGDPEHAKSEYGQILESLAANSIRAKFGDLFKGNMSRIFLLGFLLSMLIQITGINTIIDYSPIIFKTTGLAIDVALFQTFLMGMTNFIFTFVAVFLIDIIGRKRLYLIGSTGMTITLAILTAVYATGHAKGMVVLIIILCFVASFSACIGPVYWVLIAEIFPNKIRGIAMSVSVLSQWFFNFLIVLFFPWVFRNLGGSITFGFLLAMCFVQLYVTWKMVPETRNKTLEEIEKALHIR